MFFRLPPGLSQLPPHGPLVRQREQRQHPVALQHAAPRWLARRHAAEAVSAWGGGGPTCLACSVSAHVDMAGHEGMATSQKGRPPSPPAHPPTPLPARHSGLEALQQKWPQDVLPLGAVVGGLTAAAAAHLGLPEGLPVAQGGADADIGMVRRGTMRP